MGISLELINFYKKEIYKLVYKEKSISDNCIKFKSSDESKEEKNNFIITFRMYLPAFIENIDSLSYMELDEKRLKYNLNNATDNIWKQNKSLPTEKNYKQSGLFGELLNDFYLKIGMDSNILVVYGARLGFRSSSAPKGIDTIGVRVVEGKLQFIFSETKFVVNESVAVKGLTEDIEGTEVQEPHLEYEYINDYAHFSLSRISPEIKEYATEINKTIQTINVAIKRDGKKFVDVINSLNISVIFVYFAVFKSTNDVSKINYKKINDKFIENISKTKLNEYENKVVFVTTTGTSVDIKKGIIDDGRK